jgi:hypothetical protein
LPALVLTAHPRLLRIRCRSYGIVCDQQFRIFLSCILSGRVNEVDCPNVEGREYPADFWRVVERQQELAFDVLQHLRHANIIFLYKIESVIRLIKIRRIKIKESRCPIILFKYIFIRQAFELGMQQSLVDLGDEFRNLLRVVI